jgi:hypothetical protein
MFPALRRRLSYANVMATLALFIALSGTAYSAAGGNFILGQINDAGTQPTRLSANTNASTLRLTNTGTGKGNIVVAGQGSGISGSSTGGNGVEGKTASPSGSGLYGQNTGGGWALNAAGNATQSLASGGFIKAMASVDPSTGAITNCFNSQVPPSEATTGNCGGMFEYDGGPGGSFLYLTFSTLHKVMLVTPSPTNFVPLSISVYKGYDYYAYVTIADAAGNYVDAPYEIVVF